MNVCLMRFLRLLFANVFPLRVARGGTSRRPGLRRIAAPEIRAARLTELWRVQQRSRRGVRISFAVLAVRGGAGLSRQSAACAGVEVRGGAARPLAVVRPLHCGGRPAARQPSAVPRSAVGLQCSSAGGGRSYFLSCC